MARSRTYPIYIGQVYPETERSGPRGIGARVETNPACDCWMQGDRFGEITKLGSKYIHVKMDRSGKTRKFLPRDLLTVE